ncbi:MAG TPA: glycosyltransferase family 4 protein [Tepidisphaeraceae bacterium]|jgi:glycosyltransferase involved in cell wall biosynthesis
MWVVAYLCNTNGMASWCWEAAHALAEQGEAVLLVCSHAAPLPGPSAVPVLRFDEPSPRRLGTVAKVMRELRRLSTRPSMFLRALHAELVRGGQTPRAYLLNSTLYPDPAVPAPQFVVGWAYPTTFASYARKVTTYTRPSLSRHFVRGMLDTLGWYRKDWSAYRRATGVMAVSARLDDDLRAHGVRSAVVHPGTAVNGAAAAAPAAREEGTARLVIAAADLDEPRKRVRWMLDALAGGSRADRELLLVGAASEALRNRAARLPIPVRFTGPVPRDRVQELMRDRDLFLFGSRLDDWGYVLVEAMSQGLAVVAPRLSPFDEIAGDGAAGMLYDPFDPASFRTAVDDAAGPGLPTLKAAAAARAVEKFSRPAFAEALMSAARTFDGNLATVAVR